jgi:transposase
MAKARRSFTREFKIAAVKLITEQGYSLTEASRSLGVGETQLRTWKRKLTTQGEQAFCAPGPLPPLEEEVRRLRAENKRLQMERDILKKVTVFFAAEVK